MQREPKDLELYLVINNCSEYKHEEKNLTMSYTEFYIGWMPKAPAGFVKRSRITVLAILILLIIVGIVLSFFQKTFSTASFEFGQLTQVRGIYQKYPVPAIKIVSEKDLLGNTTFITIPLVGYGKFGSDGIINQLEKENNTTLDQKEITVKGTLLYSDGKTLLQIDGNDKPLVNITKNPAHTAQPIITDLGDIRIQGEVLDPKCYFGVMKPGYGKPHRDCAIRCLLGGISPVFHTQTAKGESNYYLLVGEHGEKINTKLQNFVADPVEITAHAKQIDDWIILYLKETPDIKRIGELSWSKNGNALSCIVR